MNLLAYTLKRLLLMVPTLFGVLLLTFAVVQFVPGGPVEQYLAEAKAGASVGAEGGLSYRGAQGWILSAWSKPKLCTDSTSRPRSAFGRCSSSSHASTWEPVFSEPQGV